MKVLLLNPPYRVPVGAGREKFFVRAGSRWPYSELKKISEPSLYRPFPFSIGYSAGLLKRRGAEVDVIDGVAAQMRETDFLDRAIASKADVVVIETAPFSVNSDIEIGRQLKKNNSSITVVAAGPFSALLLTTILEKGATGIDQVICGEYEFAVCGLVEALTAGRPIHIQGVHAVLSGKAPGPVEYTQPFKELDALGVPARELFPLPEKPDIGAYWDVFCQYYPSAQMHTSRGCPYGCYFCVWPQVYYHGRAYRVFSTKHVVDEIHQLVEIHKVREIYIDDDDFSIDRQRVKNICSEIINRKISVAWSCMADASNLDEATVALMARSGCIGIKFGVESAAEEVLRHIGKPVDPEQVRKVVSWAAAHGIRTHATYTFGLLGETRRTMETTLEYAIKLNTDSVQFSIATPYPGTKFYEQLKQEGWLKSFDWQNYDGSVSCVVDYPQLSAGEIESWYSMAFGRWMTAMVFRPSWLLRQIRIIFRTIMSQTPAYKRLFAVRLLQKLFPRRRTA